MSRAALWRAAVLSLLLALPAAGQQAEGPAAPPLPALPPAVPAANVLPEDGRDGSLPLDVPAANVLPEDGRDGSLPLAAAPSAFADAAAFDGARLRAPLSDAEAASAGRALYARYAPALYRDVPVALTRQPSALPGAAAHAWTPEKGHEIIFMEPEADSPLAPGRDGRVFTSFGEPGKVKVSEKLERLLAFVHEYAHAVFGELVGNVGERSLDAVYNAVNEGFAVTVERRVMDGLLRDKTALGVHEQDAADIAAMRRARSQWLRRDDNFYTEGRLRVLRPVEAREGQAGVARLVSSLEARPLLSLTRQDLAYQLSQDQPQRLRQALSGKPAPVEELLQTAPRRTVERFFSRFLLREQSMDVHGEKILYSQRWKDAFTPGELFAAVSRSPRARKLLSRWLARQARAGRFEQLVEDGPKEAQQRRMIALSQGANDLPWSKADRAAWDAAVIGWLSAR